MTHITKPLVGALLVFTALACAACSSDPAPASSTATASVAKPVQLQPADADLASLYQQSCFACHGMGAGGAPRSGNVADWAPRVAKGMDTLLDHTIDGFQGMPPLGMCGSCGEDEFVALIEFMAGGQ